MFSPSRDSWVEDSTFEQVLPVQDCKNGHEFACEHQLQAQLAASAFFGGEDIKYLCDLQ